MWYAITEFIWGSSETPKTRAKTRVEEGWIIVDTDKTPTSSSTVEIEESKEKDETVIENKSQKPKSKLTKSPIKRKIAEHQSFFDDDEYNPKSISRAKYMRDARRVLNKKDFEVLTVKETARRKKLPTTRKLKREELRHSFSPSKGSRTKTKTCFQPRGKNH